VDELSRRRRLLTKRKRRTTWTSSETYEQGLMKSGRAVKDMRINGRHMHDLSRLGVWRLA
jgi:hypothetical protein